MKSLSKIVVAIILFFPSYSSAQIIGAGANHSFANCIDGSLMVWGYNNAGQLENGTQIDSYIPIDVSGITNVTSITGGESFSIALKQDSTVWTWGSNYSGELGNGNNADSHIPVQVSNLSKVIAIAGGTYGHALALMKDSTIRAWGRNYDGDLGNGNNTASNIPVTVSNMNNVIAIAGGKNHSLALKSDGTVWAWGDNVYGTIGNGTTGSSFNLPEHVINLTGVIAIAGGGYHSLALKNDGTVWTWGYDNYGQLGNGTIGYVTDSPVMVSNLTGVIAIAGGGFSCFALKNDGTVWTWGSNSHGELGNGSTIGSHDSIPVQVSNLTGVISIAGGFQHCLALKNDGSVWAWGNHVYGTLGDGNSNVDSNVPVQVSELCIASGINSNAV